MVISLSMVVILEVKCISQRLDQALLSRLREEIPELSRSSLKEIFQKKAVHIGGRPAPPALELPEGRHEVFLAGADLATLFELARPMAAASEAGCFLDILYEDNSILVLNKTSGTPSVPHSGNETQTAVGAALAHFPALKSVGRKGLEPGILHRLDTGTSGVLAFAKSDHEYSRIQSIWKTREVKKTYRALVSGDAAFPKLPLELHPWLAHDERSAKRMIALREENLKNTSPRKPSFRGKPLPTLTRIQKATQVPKPGSLWDLEIEIETGVMHQIRCTLSSRGWPILGDALYGGELSTRLWLHAWRLSFPSAEGRRIEIQAPLPKGWAQG